MANTTAAKTSVRDLMHDRFCRADGVMTVDQAIQLLRDEDAYALLVDKRDPDDEYGLVSMADISAKILAVDRAPERVNLFEIMTKPALCVRAGMRPAYCARLLHRFRLGLALVQDADGEVIGLIDHRALVMGLAHPEH
ncbi:MAG: CBS domain-containing protein [Wenzhouxiangella sp.]|nr:MAG: CBS domain-containing protein [Wenzhouxiangella sp.]